MPPAMHIHVVATLVQPPPPAFQALPYRADRCGLNAISPATLKAAISFRSLHAIEPTDSTPPSQLPQPKRTW